MISREDLQLFRYIDDPAGALALLQSELEMQPEEVTPAFAHSRAAHSSDG
jgi:hypothetical protein